MSNYRRHHDILQSHIWLSKMKRERKEEGLGTALYWLRLRSRFIFSSCFYFYGLLNIVNHRLNTKN